MALWGSSDNVAYLYNGAVGGTVSFNYDTLEVTGTGTTFGSVGYAKTGDVLRLGFRGTGGTYFGDVTIVGIASTTSCTVASTDGLTGAAIANTSYWVSELPQWTPQAPRWSESSVFNQEDSSFFTIKTATATTSVGAGNSAVPVNLLDAEILQEVAVGDYIVNNSTEVEITGIATAAYHAQGTQGIGTDIIFISVAADSNIPPSGGQIGTVFGVLFTGEDPPLQVTSIGFGNTFVGIATTCPYEIENGQQLIYEPANIGSVISLGSVIGAGIATDDTITVKRYGKGYNAEIVGVSTAGVQSADGTQYTTDAGWVGVTTYFDNHGNLRVKTETLVAMSGIATGPAGFAGTAGGAYPPTDDL